MMNDEGVTIVQKTGIPRLTAAEVAVLQSMFRTFARLAVEAEFGMGFSGCRVFRVRPVESSGAAHRPALIKIGPAGLIENEWLAYEAQVKNTLPRITRVISPPQMAADLPWAGLRYELVGGGIFEVKSLSQYYHRATIDDLLWVLRRRLFPLMSRSWWLVNRADPTFQLCTDYDQLLPVNFLARAVEPAGGDALVISPKNRPMEAITNGKRIRLEGFIVTGMNPEQRRLTLNLPQPAGNGALDSFRIRIKDVVDFDRYRIGDLIEPLSGVVVETRRSLLEVHAREAVGPDVDLSQERLVLAGGDQLPNPLLAYEEILSTFIEVNLSTVHRDFNLENILVDPETRDVKLIDFATVGLGHNLHDLLRLETEVVTKLIPEALAEAGLGPEDIHPFYRRLHQAATDPLVVQDLSPSYPGLVKPFAMLRAIRQEARKCSFDPENPAEYYRGLAIYLLGALKFKNLDEIPGAKAVAFWAAASIVDLLYVSSEEPSSYKPEKTRQPELNRRPEPASPEPANPARAFLNRLSWPWIGIAGVLILVTAGLFLLIIKDGNGPGETLSVDNLCALDQSLTTEIVEGPAAAGDVLAYFAAANPDLFAHIDQVEQAYLQGREYGGLTYIWGSPGVGKSFISRNRLRDGFPGDSCLVKLGDLFGLDRESLDFEIMARADLSTLDGQIELDSLPAVVDPSHFHLENLFDAAGCQVDDGYAPLIIVDDIDEVHSETSNLILRALDRFVLEAVQTRHPSHIFVLGRTEGFTSWYRDPKRTDDVVPYLSTFYLNGPEWRTNSDLEILADDQWGFVLGQETWDQLKSDGSAEIYIADYIRYVTAHPILPFSIRSLAIATIITDRSRSNPADSEQALKKFLFDELLRRAAEVHHRPAPSDDGYLAILEEVAVLYSDEDLIDERGFFSVASDDTVSVIRNGQPAGEVLVSDVLDHSGIALVEPASYSTARYRFDPVWIHQHLVELHNQRVDDDYKYSGCYE